MPATSAKAAAEAKQKTEAYQKLIDEAGSPWTPNATTTPSSRSARLQKLLPGDKTSAGFLRDAQQAKSDDGPSWPPRRKSVPGSAARRR